ncbi:MAG: alpha-D-ribose 1-methylphosphonate 5-triphosphate diphosphatase [Verrucomicrobiota bacterium]
MNRTIITNARIVLPERCIEGSLVVEDGKIASIEEGGYYPDEYDACGHWLIPGVIDIHTDYIEKELHPRPSAGFPIELAFHMMDMRALASGLTTVLGAVRISDDPWKKGSELRNNFGLNMADEYERMAKISSARHYMHVRWDTNFEPVEEIVEKLSTYSRLGNIVYNENIPGQRQFRSLEDVAAKRAAAKGITQEEAMAILQETIDINSKINNRDVVRDKFSGSICIGSHDDTLVEHVDEAKEAGATLAEMPTTIEAARRAKDLGLYVCMGAPNYYRGGSHCGNLSCIDALEEDLVDSLCSDYHFPSMLGSVVKMIDSGMEPWRAVNLITLGPAKTLGWEERLGSIEVGKLADLTLFEAREGYGRVEEVWVNGVSKFSMNSPDPALV